MAEARFIRRKSEREIIRDFADYVSRGKLRAYRLLNLRLVPGKREGCFLWDVDGERRLLNCRSSGGVFNLGHRPPATIAALRAALDVGFDQGDPLLPGAAAASLAAKLAACLPGDIDRVFLGSSGGEAIDLAIEIARAATGRTKVVSAAGGYHGHTGLALAAGDPKWKEKFGPLAPGFQQIPFGDGDALDRAVDRQTAAVLFETIPATGGIAIPPEGYLAKVRDACDRAGALWIDDEVQTGLGRTGKLWAVEHWGCVPDILVLGKGMSGGLYPMAAACVRGAIVEAIRAKGTRLPESASGASDLGCAVTSAMLDEITRPGFLEHVRAMGDFFATGLADLGRRYPEMQTGVRQRGLMIGVVLADGTLGPLLSRQLAGNGVLAIFADNYPRVLQILPPLVIGESEARLVLDALDRSYRSLRRWWKLLKVGVGLVERFVIRG